MRSQAANVVTDLRGDVLRIGLGLYHDENDIDQLICESRTASKGRGSRALQFHRVGSSGVQLADDRTRLRANCRMCR